MNSLNKDILLHKKYTDLIIGVRNYIKSTADFDRQDRLWPSHYMVYNSNSIGLGYGVCGPLLFLHESGECIDERIIDWISQHKINEDEYPPGFLNGLAGIAYVFSKIGLTSKACDILKSFQKSNLLFDDSSFLHGSAGWGMMLLHLFRVHHENWMLDFAIQAAQSIESNAVTKAKKSYWKSSVDDIVYFGFGLGASGIAIFLLALYKETGDVRLRKLAIQGLEFDIKNKVETRHGLQWRRYEGDHMVLPYWMFGSAGVGTACVFAFNCLQEEKFLNIAKTIADDNFIRYAFIPSQLEGLAGIGEFMIDMFQSTNGNFSITRGKGRAFGDHILKRRNRLFSNPMTIS